MKKMKKTLFAILMSFLIVTQSMPVYALEGITQENAESVSEESSEELSEEVTEGVSEESEEQGMPAESTEDTQEAVSEEISEEFSEEISEDPTEEGSEEDREAVTEEASEEGTEDSTQNASQEPDESDEAKESEVSEENEESEEHTEVLEGIVCEPAVRSEAGENATQSDIDDTINSGNLSLELKGAYHTESADTILKRINAIRKEACDNGYINPDTGKAFKSSDYKPLKWSEDMEAIARVRASEASVYLSHTRPNGENCWTVRTEDGVSSYAENLAWNYNGLMAAIEQWYAEKEAYINKTGGVTGHYTSMISNKYNQVGVGCFYSKEKYVPYPYAVAMELTHVSTQGTTKDKTAGSCTVAIEFDGDYVKSLGISDKDLPFLIVGENAEVICNATVSYKCPMDSKVTRTITAPVDKGLTWKSSDENIASVNSAGRVTAKKVGTTKISASLNSYSAENELEIFAEGTSPLLVENLPKTTYLLGEKMDVKNATVTNRRNKKTAKLTDSDVKISGFTTEKAGKVVVKVAYDGLETTFEILALEIPKFNAFYGTTLASLPMPGNAYGTYQWVDSKDTVLSKVGENRYKIAFTPFDTKSFHVRSDISAYVYVYRELDAAWVSFPEKTYPYTGGYQEPRPIVVSDGDLVTLKNGTDYSIVTYSNNKHIGEADIVLQGEGYYNGRVTAHFTISNGQVVITAKDVVLCIDEPIPASYEYTCTGLAEGDTLLTVPTLTCDIESTAKTGLYRIIPSGAQAGDNYDITYVEGELRVVESPVFYDVTFDSCGVGVVPLPLIGVPVGETIDAPNMPQIEGYVFDGWYKDITYKNKWNFEKDIISCNVTLYAKWLKQRSGTNFYVQRIPDMTYTSKAIKPVVTVYDGDVLLKSGKDYTVSYKNNTNVNAGNVKATEEFNASLPYVTITGKGNYTDKISVNFNILPVSIGNGQPADNVTFKYQSQLAKSTSKAQSVFSSLKVIKTMKAGKDFALTLETIQAYNEKGGTVAEGTVCKDAKVPKGYTGSFLLTVQGIGNYNGKIIQEIKVSEKQNLLKNASIIIGADVKSVAFSGELHTLIPAVYDAKEKCYYRVINGGLEAPITGKKEVVDPDDVYLVKIGDKYLIQDKDFTVQYKNNDAVGTATLTIQGKGDYSGIKTATFKITGKAFNTKNITVAGMKDVVYNGSAITLSDKEVKLTYLAGTSSARELKWGKDFTVSYQKNIDKGTASVTFTGLESGGFTGKFTKKFKISAVNIADEKQVIRSESMKEITVVYDKNGVKPVDEIVLVTATGKQLKKDVDYTLSYKNNKKAATMYEDKAPVITVKGKGNYTGSFTVKFTILAGVLSDEDIRVEITPVAYSPKKKDTYVYKPTVKVYDGAKAMKAKSDYTVEYVNASQAQVRAYFEKVAQNAVTPQDAPMVRITAGTNGLYEGTKADILLPVYEKKLESKYLYILVNEEEAIFTGECVTPSVRVFYSSNAADVKRAKKTKNVDQILAYGLTEWTEGEEFEVSYGKNVTAGKNKGSVVINGITPEWGGKLTQKFTISKKQMK